MGFIGYTECNIHAVKFCAPVWAEVTVFLVTLWTKKKSTVKRKEIKQERWLKPAMRGLNPKHLPKTPYNSIRNVTRAESLELEKQTYLKFPFFSMCVAARRKPIQSPHVHPLYPFSSSCSGVVSSGESCLSALVRDTPSLIRQGRCARDWLHKLSNAPGFVESRRGCLRRSNTRPAGVQKTRARGQTSDASSFPYAIMAISSL